MPTEYKTSGLCLNCNIQTEAVLYLCLNQGGAETFVFACCRCAKRNPFGSRQYYIPRVSVEAKLTPEQIAALPVIMPDATNRCVRCGERTAEMHHWAPRKIFGNKECEQWPKDWLCKTCHDAWHKIVTPQLVKENYER